MSLDYLNEAFKRLDLLNEEAFDTSLDGINKLSTFVDEDDATDIVKVIDPEVETEDELQDSYVGKVITNCNVCHSHIYETKENIIIDSDGIVNPEKQCPYCGETAGFVIKGEIVEYNPENKPEKSDSVTVTVDGEEIPAQEETEETLEESVLGTLALAGAAGVVGGAAKAATYNALSEDEDESEEDEIEEFLTETTATLEKPDVTQIEGTIADVLNSHSSDINACGANESAVKATITRILSSGEVRNEQDAEDAIRIINNCRGPKLWSTIGTYMSGMKVAPTGRYKKDRLYASLEDSSLTEEVNNVNVETDDSIVTIQSDEDGKLTVSTEPNISTETEESIAPVSDETMTDIESNNDVVTEDPAEDETVEENPETEEESDNSEVDIDIEEVDETNIDELGESYLKNVYENVESFKTTSVSCDSTHMIVEGVITFKSGSKKNTGFIFEAHSATTDGTVKFVGKNEHFSRGSKSFVLTGKVKDKKLISESFTYNYRAKNSTGKSNRVYGTVTKQ